jgi:hypothetical protein
MCPFLFWEITVCTLNLLGDYSCISLRMHSIQQHLSLPTDKIFITTELRLGCSNRSAPFPILGARLPVGGAPGVNSKLRWTGGRWQEEKQVWVQLASKGRRHASHPGCSEAFVERWLEQHPGSWGKARQGPLSWRAESVKSQRQRVSWCYRENGFQNVGSS